VVERGKAQRKLRKIAKLSNAKVAFAFTRTGAAPDAREVHDQYVTEHGVTPDITVLMHTSGDLYFSMQRGARYDWCMLRDMCYENRGLVDTLFGCVDDISALIESVAEFSERRAIQGHARLAQALEWIQNFLDEESNQIALSHSDYDDDDEPDEGTHNGTF
jgi:hypothetical protein